MRRIPLSASRTGVARAYAVVDDEDYERLCAMGPWTLVASGYAVRRRPRVTAMHRVVLGLDYDDPMQCDHINRDPLDNRRSNLRAVTAAQNRQNLGAWGATSRFRGVGYRPDGRDHKKWIAQVYVDGKCRLYKRFHTELEAAVAADAGRRELQPFALPDPALAEALNEAA